MTAATYQYVSHFTTIVIFLWNYEEDILSNAAKVLGHEQSYHTECLMVACMKTSSRSYTASTSAGSNTAILATLARLNLLLGATNRKVKKKYLDQL